MFAANHPVRFVAIIVILIAASIFTLQTDTAKALTLTEDEKVMLDLINQERHHEGLKPLEMDTRLTKIARSHSQEMIDLNFFSHYSSRSGSFFNRLRTAGIKNWQNAGENLAGATTVEIAFRALMESPKHKENLLSPRFTRIGIEIRDGGPYGKMFTQHFLEEASALPIETKNAGLTLLLLASALFMLRRLCFFRFV
jgi:uncharacterized protein YkwD